MLALLIVGLLLALLGSTYMYVLGQYPGYILLRAGDFAIEMNLWFLLSALIIGGILLFILWRVLRKIGASFFGSLSWLKSRPGKRADQRATAGLKHYFEGDWQAAKKDLALAAKSSSNPMLHYLAAADSASKLGLEEESERLRIQAEQYADKNDPLWVFTQTRILLKSGKSQEAENLFNTLPEGYRKNASALDLHFQIYAQNNDWKNCLQLLPKLKSAKVYSGDGYEKLEVEVWSGLLEAAASNDGGGVDGVRACWRSLPKALHKNAELVRHYAIALHKLGQDDEAEVAVKNALKHSWQPDLLALYGMLKVDDVKAQLSTAESWLSKHSDEAKLYYVLGKLSARNEFWGKARDYFEKSLSLQKSPEAYAALGDLMVRLGDREKSTQLYREGLRTAVSG